MGKFKFSKKHRLLNTNEFKCVFASAQKTKSGYLRCHWIKNDLGYMRLGIIVTKKFGKAYQRNHFKRLVREAFRTFPYRFSAGLDIIILPRFSERTQSGAVMQRDLHYVLTKITQT